MELRLRIDWSELDALGHVNNLQIMKYVQSARVNYLDKVDLLEMHADGKIGVILASIHTQFLKPLFFPGDVAVFSRIEYVKTSSFKLLHEIYNDKNELVAEATDILVMYDYHKGHKVPVPDVLRKKFEELEKRILNL
ncbi:MAG TPA: thioesterase family protein [Paludibacter sp.]|nr:thioesterase family protein [Paludibacter sp.]